MAGIYDNIDLEFGWNGDLVLGSNHDIKDTSDNMLQGIIDQIHSIAASTINDWEIYPNRGSSLMDYIGEPSSKPLASAISERMKAAIVSAGIVAQNDILVKVLPVGPTKLLIIISVNAISSPFNNLRQNEPLTVSLVFNTQEQSVFISERPIGSSIVGGEI